MFKASASSVLSGNEKHVTIVGHATHHLSQFRDDMLDLFTEILPVIVMWIPNVNFVICTMIRKGHFI